MKMVQDNEGQPDPYDYNRPGPEGQPALTPEQVRERYGFNELANEYVGLFNLLAREREATERVREEFRQGDLEDAARYRELEGRVRDLQEALTPLLGVSFTMHPRTPAEQESFDAVMETYRRARALVGLPE